MFNSTFLDQAQEVTKAVEALALAIVVDLIVVVSTEAVVSIGVDLIEVDLIEAAEVDLEIVDSKFKHFFHKSIIIKP